MFGFPVVIRLEVPRDERVTNGVVMRVAIHEESFNVGLVISMLPALSDCHGGMVCAWHSWSPMLGKPLSTSLAGWPTTTWNLRYGFLCLLPNEDKH